MGVWDKRWCSCVCEKVVVIVDGSVKKVCEKVRKRKAWEKEWKKSEKRKKKKIEQKKERKEQKEKNQVKVRVVICLRGFDFIVYLGYVELYWYTWWGEIGVGNFWCVDEI